MSSTFVIDACALINAAKSYNMKKSTFTPIWDKIDEMITEGQLISSAEILEELKDKELQEWAKSRKKAFLPVDEPTQRKVIDILKDYPSLIKLKSIGNSNGDPFLIATAILHNSSIVTDERLGDEKSKDYHIPNVCKKLNIPCINLQNFLDKIID